MKKTIVKIMLAVTAITAPLAARADLIWYEGFNYADGSLTNVSTGLWIKTSGTANPSDMWVKNKKVEVSATGGTVSRQDDCYRKFALTPNSPYTNTVQLIYVSFTVICTNLPNGAGSYFATIYNTGAGFFGRVQAFTNGTVLPNTWRLGVTANALSANPNNGGYPVDLALNTPYQVVEELDPVSLKAATIWINPLNIYQAGDPGSATPPTETHYTSSDAIGAAATTAPVNAFCFRQAGSFGNSFFQITNLAIATTFAEAATNVWTTNAFKPVMVYQPTGTTNFTGASILLSAVVNGQGLGNMTYQWQQNGLNYSANPANTNVLTIPSALTTDSGDFTLIATTPFGLSVTSTVAKVSITDAPVPPSFVTQPASLTVYSGQTATLSTTVIGPTGGDPVTYTWYSNNVVVTAGQSDNGHASSYVFNNATTNDSATYKVAVTNAFGGRVSTNAVLTVRNPATVTIGYLRTLVDPNNGYNSTNTPPSIAYQVTGTVTTFTNITTGSTASYYLQDGTAGINIFVTGGSAFRPAQGAVVTFVGVLSSFTSGLELYADSADTQYPYTSYTDTGATNALPAPISIGYDVATNLNNLNYNLMGSLVKLSDCNFGTNAGLVLSTTANNVVTVTNASGKKFNLFFAFLDLDTAGQTLPSYAYSVTGVLYGLSTNASYSVAVTRFADIVTTAPPVPIPLGLNYSGGNLTFNWSDPTFSLQSATNVVGPYITITGATTGFVTNSSSSGLPAMFFRLYHP